jgi:hypothetical protein
VFEAGECGQSGFGVFVHPAVMDEPDRDGIEVVQFLAPAARGDNEAGLFEQLQVLS